MSSSPEAGSVWSAVGPEALVEVLVPLRDEHHRHGAVALIAENARHLETVAGQLAGSASLLVVEDPAQSSLRSNYTSPFVKGADGHNVVLGWLRLDAQDLTAYVRRAVALLQRPSEPELPLLLLGPRERRYSDLLDAVEHTTRGSPAVAPFRWSAERIRRRELVEALRHGAGAVLYTGHGNADGWFAYGGLSSGALTDGDDWRHDETTAVMFSLACRTGQPRVRGMTTALYDMPAGFADHVVARGVAGVVVAPLDDPLHTENRMLATTVARKLCEGHRSCCDLLNAVHSEGVSLHHYAIVGDPALRAASSEGAARRCESVFAPAPDADLEYTGVPAVRHLAVE